MGQLVPLANLDLSERRKIKLLSRSPLLMVIFLAALTANLRSIFHSRAALELENLAVLRQNLAHLWNQSVNQPPTFEPSGKILP